MDRFPLCPSPSPRWPKLRFWLLPVPGHSRGVPGDACGPGFDRFCIAAAGEREAIRINIAQTSAMSLNLEKLTWFLRKKWPVFLRG